MPDSPHGYVFNIIRRMGFISMFLSILLMVFIGPFVWLILARSIFSASFRKSLFSTLLLLLGYAMLYDTAVNQHPSYEVGLSVLLLMVGYVVMLTIRPRPKVHEPPGTYHPEQEFEFEPESAGYVSDAEEFEEDVARMFRLYGYNVERTPYRGDHGIDLKLSKPPEYAVVQCKKYTGNVGEPAVRDFYGAMMHEGATSGYMVTTSNFTQQAKEWAKGKHIALVDGEYLKHMMYESKIIGRRPV